MAGRNGSDDLARFESVAALVLVFIAAIINALSSGSFGSLISGLLWMAAIALMILCYARIFSKNIYKRRAENGKYLAKRARFMAWFRGKRTQFRQRRDFCFFSCPSCKAVMRVPRGKGKIKIVCRKCGEAFIRKT